MRGLTLFFCLIIQVAYAQLPINEEQFLSRLQLGGTLPENLLKTKSVVFHSFQLSTKDLEAIQKTFQRTGIDAVAYYEADFVHAGRDASVNLAAVLNKREISNLVYIQRTSDAYTIYISEYNRKANLVEPGQKVWTDKHRALDVLLQQLYRTATNSLKNENLLINDLPEPGGGVGAIDGTRNEFFAIDLRSDLLAVPRFADSIMNKELEEVMKQYPFKFAFTDPTLSEADLKKQGYFYVLRFVSARNKVARQVLEYKSTRAQNAAVSVKFSDRSPQMKSINLNDYVFKFYFKHLESGNVFLGTKWDSDQSWSQALQNQITGFKIEFGIE